MTRALSIGLVLSLVLAPLTSRAGLRPVYGGELVVRVPELPKSVDPALAWTPAELLVSGALSVPVRSLAREVTEEGHVLRLLLPDGEASRLAGELSSAFDRAVVALPPMTFEADGPRLIVTTPPDLPLAREALDWTWLRVAPREAASFSFRKRTLETQSGPRRPMLDKIRLEARTGKYVPPGPSEMSLTATGTAGRAVVAIPRPGAPAADALRHLLVELDRATLVRLFVRGVTVVPPDRYAAPGPFVKPGAPVLVAVDESEKDLKTLAQKLQLALKDRKIPARVVAEERSAHRQRLLAGGFDLALVALPPAPEAVQAATLLRFAGPGRSTALVWSEVVAGGTAPLAHALDRTGARLLYLEGGGIESGSLVRAAPLGLPWNADLGAAWLAPRGSVP